MANTVLVGYDLNRPGQDYTSLFEAIKSLGAWWHHLDSTWLIKTSYSAEYVRDSLRPHLDNNDELLVTSLTGEAAWHGFSDSGGSWLYNNL